MKFESFVKYAGGNGSILESENGEKWLFYGSIGMKIPEGKNVCGNTAVMPGYVNDLIINKDFIACELVDAVLPAPDSKPSDIIRKFGAPGVSVGISNKAFGFIERKDNTYISENAGDDDNYTALLVTDEISDDPEFKMIYIVKG